MPYKDPEMQRQYQQEWMRRRRTDFFEGKTCVRCGSDQSLELDHIDPAKKEHHAIWSWSQQRREAEIAKCQVLCHGCHVKKTVANHEMLRGEQVTISKLTESDVREILRLWELGGWTKAALGRKFDTHERNIRLILKGEAWKHISREGAVQGTNKV